MSLTGDHNYFEDFHVGQLFRHRRGRTITAHGNTYFTLTTMNTGAAHFNKHMMLTYLGGRFPERRVNGGYTISLVVGLTSQDIAENTVAEIGFSKIRSHRAVHPEDTLYARSEILGLEDSPERPDAGTVHYRFEGYNQNDEQVLEGERIILVKKRAYCGAVEFGTAESSSDPAPKT
ncbi:MAG: MaoC family dehydratase [Gammaproteobacteria bacterium]|nr:MaoC family dehydratase [Gammaproteobacteria bacterium]